MKRLAIANRGEIAIRIARTAADMGIETVGIYTSDDENSMHVRRMDKAVQLPGKGARGYLDIEAVIKAAIEAGADALHPGYGFLSENAEFAKAAIEAGITFVGPSPESLNTFGDKSAAITLAKRLDVPVIGDGTEVNLQQAKKVLEALGGSPMLLKAIAGGGGRGVRIVRDAGELEDAFARASSEAKATFGNPGLYVEPYLENVRHIEVQILGDGKGGVSHLWERDCTLQRRHQKIIEIAPAPHLDSALRSRIIAAAVKLGEAVQYSGAGTMEFLVSGTAFYFIEGNARLQVEHTVTEEILGIDIVRAQLDIAAGISLNDMGLGRGQIPQPNGFAIQARVCLESLTEDGDIKPSIGVISEFAPPTGPGIRIDTSGYAGYAANPNYDSLIAKVISHAPNYDRARGRLKRAISEFEIGGVPSNLSTLEKLLADSTVAGARVHTRFIDDNAAKFASGAPPSAQRSTSAPADPLAVLEHGQSHGTSKAPAAAPPLASDVLVPPGMEAVRANMSGILVKYEVAKGDAVWAGKTVAIIEAMKMEHELKSNVSGIVTALCAVPGDAIPEDNPIVILRPESVEATDDDTSGEIDLDYIRPDLAEALERISAGHDENRPKAVEKRHGRGNRTARENIADLCDEDSFVEYGSVVLAAQRRRREMDDLIANTTGDGMVCGLGHVNGDLFPETQSRVMAMSYDYMVLAGTQGALNHYKKDRMFEIAEHQRLPVVLYAEGGGGRPGDTDTTGVAGLDCLAFTYFAKLSGLVPTIGIVNGRCFAGNAVLLGCCDVIIATENSNISIGGPAMIEGGGLGVFRPEEVGPSDVQNANGVIDVLVRDEAEATKVAKQYLSYFQGTVDGTMPFSLRKNNLSSSQVTIPAASWPRCCNTVSASYIV